MQSRIELKVWEAKSLPPDWFKRTRTLGERALEAFESDVNAIINEVKEKGDRALVKFTKNFDKAEITTETIRVTREEIEKAYQTVSEEQIAALRVLKEKVATFEGAILKQMDFATPENGITVQNMLFPIDSVGCYVPGGQASYPSTVVMTTAPAKVAGVPRIVVCSPPSTEGAVNPLVLVAADICGVDEIFKVGGAQAIAALAYGTESIKPVRKIVGPGSKYVTMAKALVSKDVAIDMPAGPSEILVLADDTANPRFVAADMISQAEHGGDSVAGLISTSRKLAEEVIDWLKKLAETAERGSIVATSLSECGFVIICDTVEEMVVLANTFAPEHLEIITRNPMEVADKVTSAGLILIGPFSPVSLSDYGSGTNHVLPTAGFANAFSGLSALDFARRVSVVESSKEGLLALKNHIKVLTEAEKLPNHYRAVEVRFTDET